MEMFFGHFLFCFSAKKIPENKSPSGFFIFKKNYFLS